MSFRLAPGHMRNIQDDDFMNPGILWVENGEKLWNKHEGSKNKSCYSCHGNSSNMKGVSLKYPMVISERRERKARRRK